MISVIATIPIEDSRIALKVGMFVNAEIEGLSYSGVTIVPRNAVKNDMIWVVQEQKLRRKSVEVLRLENDFAFISDGLTKNDRVLITRLSSYVDGMPVRVK
jgi:multidrug efflux pump subunit AcrA (membrane-fusion protein)